MWRWGVGLAASLTLAACEGALSEFEPDPAPAGGGEARAVGTKSITVTRNKTELSGPDGFCVDPESTDLRAAQAFVVFGNCAAITNNPDEPQPLSTAILLASVTSAGLTGDGAVAPSASELALFFRSTEGRATLSRASDPANVVVDESFAREGVVYLRVRDISPSAVDGAQTAYWRGYFDAGNSVVSVTVIGLEDAPLTASEGLSVLRSFVEANATTPDLDVPSGSVSGAAG